MESRSERRLRCWESVFHKGVIEAPCPVCRCSTIRYSSTSGNTFQQLHIVPASKSGSDQSWNLVPGCGCNQNMRHMNLVDWMGTKGNKKQLMKDLFLCKYKSLVAPCNRTTHDREQLIKWVYATYHPLQLEEYRDWMILLEQDLANMQRDNVVIEVSSSTIKDESNPITLPPSISLVEEVPLAMNEEVLVQVCNGPIKEEKTHVVLERPSPYFTDPSRYKTRSLKQHFAGTNIHMPYPI